jgi:hypothetical protein
METPWFLVLVLLTMGVEGIALTMVMRLCRPISPLSPTAHAYLDHVTRQHHERIEREAQEWAKRSRGTEE